MGLRISPLQSHPCKIWFDLIWFDNLKPFLKYLIGKFVNYFFINLFRLGKVLDIGFPLPTIDGLTEIPSPPYYGISLLDAHCFLYAAAYTAGHFQAGQNVRIVPNVRIMSQIVRIIRIFSPENIIFFFDFDSIKVVKMKFN